MNQTLTPEQRAMNRKLQVSDETFLAYQGEAVPTEKVLALLHDGVGLDADTVKWLIRLGLTVEDYLKFTAEHAG